jgi:CheY-like chemotaxis protein
VPRTGKGFVYFTGYKEGDSHVELDCHQVGRSPQRSPRIGDFKPLPQVGEENIRQAVDVDRPSLVYDIFMTRVYLADAHFEERLALRLVFLDLNMLVVGEAADWPTTLALAPATCLDMLLVDWNLLPIGLGVQSIAMMRLACPNAIVVVLISHLDSRDQAALSAGADAFISKGESPERVTIRLRALADGIVLN